MAKVWVIDDEEAVTDVIVGMLQALGHDARSFTQAREALAAYRPGVADVVMTDVRMPDMDGLEVTRRLREKDPQLAIIVVTGFPSVDDAVEAIKLGADDYLNKPLRIEEVRLRVLRVMEAHDLADRLRRNRILTWLLIGSLPVWFVLGILLTFVVGR